MTDTDTHPNTLALAYLLTEPAIRSAIQTLRLPPGSRGLDAGCGVGLHIPLLVKAVAPGGHVTGLDLRSDLLVRAEEIAEESGLSGQVRFQEGDLNQLAFDDDTFDWAWGADALWPGPSEMGCPAEEPLPLVSELARVVKPGGIVAIVFWSSQKLLPGYPLLEARQRHLSRKCPFHPGDEAGGAQFTRVGLAARCALAGTHGPHLCGRRSRPAE